jgi:uncharacterized protein (TIGR00725 family)
MKPTINIGVLGPNTCTEEEYQLGYDVGRELAETGTILVCGGLGGMMEAAAKGAKDANGTTVGILPGDQASDANPYITVPLPTGLGPFRNMMVARMSDAVIAIHGAYGTLSEIAFALRLGVPVIGLHTWQLMQDGKEDPGIVSVTSPAEAVREALKRTGR